MTKEADRKAKIDHVNVALRTNGYTEWMFAVLKKQKGQKPEWDQTGKWEETEHRHPLC